MEAQEDAETRPDAAARISWGLSAMMLRLCLGTQALGRTLGDDPHAGERPSAKKGKGLKGKRPRGGTASKPGQGVSVAMLRDLN